MPNIVQDLPIKVPPARVFAAISTPSGLNTWWTKTCAGTPAVGSTYDLGFGQQFQWQAKVTQCKSPVQFALEVTRADADWTGTVLTFALSQMPGGTQLRFSHHGWPALNDHYRVSCHCWALYLRLLRRNLEFGETVPYEARLDA